MNSEYLRYVLLNFPLLSLVSTYSIFLSWFKVSTWTTQCLHNQPRPFKWFIITVLQYKYGFFYILTYIKIRLNNSQ